MLHGGIGAPWGVRGALGWPSREIIRPFWQKRAREPNRNRTGLACSLVPAKPSAVCGWSVVSVRTPTRMGGRMAPSERSVVAQWPYPSPILVPSWSCPPWYPTPDSLVPRSILRFVAGQLSLYEPPLAWAVEWRPRNARLSRNGPILVLSWSYSGRIPGVPTNESAICGWSGPIGAAEQGRGDGPCNWCHQW